MMDLTQLAEMLAVQRAAPLDWRHKAAPPQWYGRTVDEVLASGPTLDDLSTPQLTLDRTALTDNLAQMGRWCTDAGLSLAPHGKTTMAPALWWEQLEAGSWAISVANEPQLRVARAVGVPRVILANMLLARDALAWLSRELDADPEWSFMCWVDSISAVRLMDEALAAAGARRPVPVLIELGSPGARTGVRTHAGGLDVAAAVRAAPTLVLAGVAGYEGSVAHGTDESSLAAVDNYLRRLVELHRALLGQYGVPEAVLSAGGSAYFDRVETVLAPESGDRGPVKTRVVLRSGAYLVHDDGYYRGVTPHQRGAGPVLRSAMHAWARVLSMPEPGIAYLDAGKRDLPVDEGLPEVQLLRRDEPAGCVVVPLAGHVIHATNDHHAHVRVPGGSPLRVGDVVRLGLSHPCTALDKWSLIPVVDDASAEVPAVVDLVHTYF